MTLYLRIRPDPDPQPFKFNRCGNIFSVSIFILLDEQTIADKITWIWFGTNAVTALPNKLVDLWSGGGLNADAGEGQLQIVRGTGWAQLREGQVVHTKVLMII